jgi:hypothetical protein
VEGRHGYLEVEEHLLVDALLAQPLDGDVIARFKMECLIYNAERALAHLLDQLLLRHVCTDDNREDERRSEKNRCGEKGEG